MRRKWEAAKCEYRGKIEQRRAAENVTIVVLIGVRQDLLRGLLSGPVFCRWFQWGEWFN